MKIPRPEGLEMPEGTEKGDEFDALATVKVNEDGSLTLKALDGHPVGDSDEQETEAAADDEGYLEAVNRQM